MLLNNRRPLVVATCKLAEAMKSDDHEHIAALTDEVRLIAERIESDARAEYETAPTCPTCRGTHEFEYSPGVFIPCPDCYEVTNRLLANAIPALGLRVKAGEL